MPDEAALAYAAAIVFGIAIGGLLVATLLRSRTVPALRRWKARRLDSKVRRALQSSTPDRLAKVMQGAVVESVEPLLYVRHWTTLGWFSRSLKDEAARVERAIPQAIAAAHALAWALYGAFERAEEMLASGRAAPGHETMTFLQLDFLLHLLRDRNAASALASAHQGVAAAKASTLGAWAQVWSDRLRAAECAAGEHSFDEIDELMRSDRSTISALLIAWAACAHATAVGDEGRARVYSTAYRELAPYGAAP